jgi:hypothetical protein
MKISPAFDKSELNLYDNELPGNLSRRGLKSERESAVPRGRKGLRKLFTAHRRGIVISVVLHPSLSTLLVDPPLFINYFQARAVCENCSHGWCYAAFYFVTRSLQPSILLVIIPLFTVLHHAVGRVVGAHLCCGPTGRASKMFCCEKS